MNTDEADVLRQVARLKGERLRTIERQTATKRAAILREFLRNAPLAGPPTPRLAYELFLLRHLGLSPDDVPVVREDDREIAWQSANRCPTLEACERLGRDTRLVCRGAYEKSTQAFLSVLDPQLRFCRDYDLIRPHAPSCSESIVRLDFAALMNRAIAAARRSLAEGNRGYGAVVVMGSRVLATAHDTATTDNDPSLHAELKAVRQAARELGDANLCGAVLISTCEPCPMCSALAAWANVTTIVYGASIAETAKRGKARIRITADEVVRRSPAWVEVIGGVQREECLQLYS